MKRRSTTMTERGLRVAVAGLLVASLATATGVVDGHREAPGKRTFVSSAAVGPSLVSFGDAVEVPAEGWPAVATTAATVAPVPASPETTTPSVVARPPSRRQAASASRPVAPRAPRPRPTGPADPAAMAAYHGLGTWVDVYDWSQTYTREGAPEVDAGTVDRMAAEGVQTLYIQASKHDAPTDVLEPERLMPIISRAHEQGMVVVAWYLPSLVDPARDLQRLLAIASLDVDGLAVDIEARNVTDVDERNRRLVQLSTDLRASLPQRVLGAIVLPPVVLEEVNPNYWPNFPYQEIAPLYDVWQTMGYWTNRKQSSGWRNAHAYTVENVVRLRRNLGLPEAVVHPIGGIGDQTTPADVDGFLRAARETHCVGGSLYDWRTTKADAWPGMRGFQT